MSKTYPAVFPVNYILMETTRSVSGQPRDLPIVGGHLALDFANTVDNPLGPTRHDHLTDYEELIVWSLRVAVASTDQAGRLRHQAVHRGPEATAALRHAHGLRDILNDVFGA